MGCIEAKGEPRPLTPEKATERINYIAGHGYTVSWTEDIPKRLKEKGLIVGDLNYALRYGSVVEEGSLIHTALYFKYIVESKTPNWIGKNIKIVVLLEALTGLR